MKKGTRKAFICFVTLLMTLMAFARATGPEWAITELRSLGGDTSVVYGLSGQGAVGASRDANGVEQAVYWRANSTTFASAERAAIPLPSLGGPGGCAYRINEVGGFIVGKAKDGKGSFRPTLWRRDEGAGRFKPTDLGTFGGSAGVAYNLNNNASALSIVGAAQNERGEWQATLWKKPRNGEPASPVALPGLGGGDSFAYGINENGVIVGKAQTHDGRYHAVAWVKNGIAQSYEIQDLDPNGQDSEARGVNSNNRVVGSRATLSGAKHAFRTATATARPVAISVADDLSTLGGLNSWAVAINESDDVVGWSEFSAASSDVRAFHVSATAPMVNLGGNIAFLSAWTVTHAHALPEVGSDVIAVSAFDRLGQPKAALLTPPPKKKTGGKRPVNQGKGEVRPTNDEEEEFGEFNLKKAITGIGTISGNESMTNVASTQNMSVSRGAADTSVIVELTTSSATTVAINVNPPTLTFDTASSATSKNFPVVARDNGTATITATSYTNDSARRFVNRRTIDITVTGFMH